MKRILVTIGGYLPGTKYGGPVTSISNFVYLLKDEFDLYIVTSNHDLNTEKIYEGIVDGWNKVGAANVKYLSDKDMSNVCILKSIINEIKPDVIYHNGLYDRRMAIPIAILSRHRGIPPIIFVPRGDLGPVFPEKKKYIKKAYVLFMRLLMNYRRIIFQATSIDEKNDIINRMGVPSDCIHLIGNIPTMIDNKFSRIKKKSGEVKLIYFARVHPTKNLLTAIKSLHSLHGDITFDIYGGVEDDNYWEQCKSEIQLLSSNVKVHYHGVAKHEMVYECFACHHALFFPTRNKENFGHTIVEGIMSERPVIISDQSPWNDLKEYGAGWVYAGDDVDSFSLAIQELIDMDDKEYSVLCQNVKRYKDNKFSVQKTKEKYDKMLVQAMKKGLN